MFNNKKTQKRQKWKKMQKKEKENIEKKCNLYFKTACTRLGKSYLE